MKKAAMTKKTMIAALSGLLVLGGATAYTTAYLTDHEGAVNEFTVGKVDIELEEPNWKDEHTELQPSEVVKKDPQITNNGKNDAYVYLEVSIPVRTVIAANADGTRQPEKKQEVFSFSANTTDWNLLKKEENGDMMVYTYNYNKVLAKDTTTSPLFETVTFLNVIEGPLDLAKLEIPVKAFAIQTENTGGTGTTVNKQAAAAYNRYLNQNKDLDGKVTVQTQVSE